MKPLDPMTFKERVWLYTYAPVMVLLSVLIEEDESELGSDAWPPTWQPPPKNRRWRFIDRLAVRLRILNDEPRCDCPRCVAERQRVRCCPNCDAR